MTPRRNNERGHTDDIEPMTIQINEFVSHSNIKDINILKESI
jgi:hypothetical protein